MATLRDIRRRIRSTKNTQQITRAMKMIAASKLRKVQDRLSAIRPYSEALGRTLRRALEEATEDQHPLLWEREVKTSSAAFFTGDRGLCGAYNGNLIRATQSFLEDKRENSPKVIAIGKKGVDFVRRRAIDVLETHTNIAETMTFRAAVRMARSFVQYYLDNAVDELYLIHSTFVSTMRHPISRHKLLPLDAEKLPEAKEGEEKLSSHVVIYEPSHEGVLPRLFDAYFAAMVYRAFLESMTSEYACRMTAMDAATENAEEMIGRLTMDYNRARQRAITREILDIVGGAEALK